MTDFCDVAPQHSAVHAELENWARWCAPHRRTGLCVSPMFAGYRPPTGYFTLQTPRMVDTLAAAATQKRYALLPEENRHALCWAYVYPWVNPGKVQRQMGITRLKLAELVQAGRQMMKM